MSTTKALGSIFFAALLLGIAFQNCSKMGVTAMPTADGLNGTSGGPPGQLEPGVGDTLQSIHPVFAVRAMNCVACHGSIGSNIATDFGYGSPNFMPHQSFFPNGTRTAFNDTDVGNNIGGWQSLIVNGGSVHVPAVTIPKATANIVFGINNDTTFSQVLQWLNAPNSSGRSMVHGVTPAAGQAAVIEDKSITISYPSESEIVSMLPAALQSNAIAISASQKVSATSQVTGLVADTSGRFIRNSSTVECYGDVVVKGSLFLKNLNLKTDSNGCRLYVSKTVFIQGPIVYVNGGNSNLQISSARAIIMGLSADRMGADPSGGRVNDTIARNITAGGPWPRFALIEDVEYNPSGAAINGLAAKTFFDNIVSDAVSIGSELLDAGDVSYVNHPGAGETVVTEPATPENANVGGPRISIDYSGLLLNAPHIHSRYAGVFKGVIIADVAMLARNPSATQLEQFLYDSTFDNIPSTSILPALTTQILSIEH